MKLTLGLLMLSVLGATPAFAEYEPKIIPKCSLSKGVCGYTLDQWKLVLWADAELVSSRIKLKNASEHSAQLTLQVGSLRSQVDVYAESQKTLLARTSKLTDDLISLDKKYQDERVKPRWGSPVAWTVAGVSTSILVGFLAKSILD